jgi:hypothetical protein
LIEGIKRDRFPAQENKGYTRMRAGKKYLDFFWIGKDEVLTLASQKEIIHPDKRLGG